MAAVHSLCQTVGAAPLFAFIIGANSATSERGDPSLINSSSGRAVRTTLPAGGAGGTLTADIDRDSPRRARDFQETDAWHVRAARWTAGLYASRARPPSAASRAR